MTVLYDQDFQLWLSQTINQLENQQFDQLDLGHLIEELADLGNYFPDIARCIPHGGASADR